MRESGGARGSGTCCIDHSPELRFTGSAPVGMAEQQRDQHPLMQGGVISGKAPHRPLSAARETRQRDAPSTSRFNLITRTYVDRIATVTIKSVKLAPTHKKSVTL